MNHAVRDPVDGSASPRSGNTRHKRGLLPGRNGKEVLHDWSRERHAPVRRARLLRVRAGIPAPQPGIPPAIRSMRQTGLQPPRNRALLGPRISSSTRPGRHATRRPSGGCDAILPSSLLPGSRRRQCSPAAPFLPTRKGHRVAIWYSPTARHAIGCCSKTVTRQASIPTVWKRILYSRSGSLRCRHSTETQGTG